MGATRCRSCGFFVPDSAPLIDGQCSTCMLWSSFGLILRGIGWLAIAAFLAWLAFAN